MMNCPPYSIKAKCGNKQVVVEKRPEAGVSKLLKEPGDKQNTPCSHRCRENKNDQTDEFHSGIFIYFIDLQILLK
jgi:hypothetical protein